MFDLHDSREAMITSHQNRIEQLRASFKEKMADAERWEEKVFHCILVLVYTKYAFPCKIIFV